MTCGQLKELKCHRVKKITSVNDLQYKKQNKISEMIFRAKAFIKAKQRFS